MPPLSKRHKNNRHTAKGAVSRQAIFSLRANMPCPSCADEISCRVRNRRGPAANGGYTPEMVLPLPTMVLSNGYFIKVYVNFLLSAIVKYVKNSSRLYCFRPIIGKERAAGLSADKRKTHAVRRAFFEKILNYSAWSTEYMCSISSRTLLE